MQTSPESSTDFFTPPTPDDQAAHHMWHMLGILYRWRFFVIGLTMLAAVGSVGIVLSPLVPIWYKASSRLLLPADSGSDALSSALLNDLPAAAQALLGGGGGDYIRYIALLSSRRMYERVVDEYDLVTVYDLGESEHPVEDAIEVLADNALFEIDAEYDFLSISVFDQSPQRAADISNFFTDELNRLNATLTSESARNYRVFIEKRYEETETALNSLLDSLQVFQEEYGLFDVTTQTSAYFEQLADLRINAVQAEIQFDALRTQYGDANKQAQAFRDIARAANQKYEDALAGQEALLPIPQTEVPEVMRRYLDIERELRIQARIIEFVRPLYEQARFDEQREAVALQVIDPAIPPVEKAKPKRSILVIVATMTAFILAVLFALVYEWWQRNYARFANRLQEAAVASRPKS